MEAPQTWAGAKVRIGGQKQFTIHLGLLYHDRNPRIGESGDGEEKTPCHACYACHILTSLV